MKNKNDREQIYDDSNEQATTKPSQVKKSSLKKVGGNGRNNYINNYNFITDMTTELFKKVEETVTVNGIEEKRTTSVEYILRDGDNEIGRLNVNEWGVNFNISKGFDVEGMATELLDIITLVQ